MRRRAEQVDETRRRITEAAVRLHTTVGPAATTVSALAEEAGVTRVTVYRHFADEEALFDACRAHWASEHPFPDLGAAGDIADPVERARHMLTALYAWYRDNHEDLYPIYRDAPVVPEPARAAMASEQRHLAELVAARWPARGRARRRLLAAAGHAVSLWTWRSLAVEQGLADRDCVELALAMLAAAGDPS